MGFVVQPDHTEGVALLQICSGDACVLTEAMRSSTVVSN